MSLLTCSSSRRNLEPTESGSTPMYRYYTRAIGRKRVVSDSTFVWAFNFPSNNYPRKRRSLQSNSEMPNLIEDLPEDLLILIICGVDYSDLRRLFFVSRTMRRAVLLAKQLHFAFRTPSKGVTTFDDRSGPHAPDAPLQARKYKSRINGDCLKSINVALFQDEEMATEELS